MQAASPAALQQEQLQALSWWALQFSPRVCVLEASVLLEASGSERLFGGRRALLGRIQEQAQQQGVPCMAVAPTALAALALLQTLAPQDGLQLVGCNSQQLQATLDALPATHLAAARPHDITLQQLGCHTLGPLRALPRGGVSRRFGADLLRAIDQAYGLAAESYAWVQLPEQFTQRLEFLGRIEVASGLMFGVHRLLLQLKAWLLARQCGTTGLVLRWEHDLQRRSEAASGTLSVRTAEATRDTTHLARLLAEHLARTTLAAPVVAITLEALDVQAQPDHTPSLLPQDQASGDSLQQLVERLSARLGPSKVLRPQAHADHRTPQHQSWQPATWAKPKPRQTSTPPFPAALAQQPPWLLRQPLALAMHGDRPLYQGQLTRLAGPERIEANWWDSAPTRRDYYLALSEHAGLVWIYREPQTGWFLHGIYG
ncbi:Y-family DNA polymerase [Variovorax sp. HJSM1_2]|uniref:Y-family DNA polymerase n=1 Tax=Variovorax sp. HJSM1_2 TaxID=3366263 RepID=UPI003BD8B436